MISNVAPVYSNGELMLKKWLMLLGLIISVSAYAQPAYISIIIDDMGNNHRADAKVINLPGDVVCSVMPDTKDAVWSATEGHLDGKQVIGHIPMQPLKYHHLGPTGLKVNMSKQYFDEVLEQDISDIPYIEGINNHMGSLLTQQPRQMNWVMHVIKPDDLFYIDSLTINKSVAGKVADIEGIPSIRRNVFLDDNPTVPAVAKQFNLLIRIARKYGMAVAIGHPYPATIQFLQQELPKLQQQNIELVPVSELVADREAVRNLTQPF